MHPDIPQKIPSTLSSFFSAEFKIKKKKNSQYSLRAFARDLDISSGKLSDIINGKSGITKDTASSISNRLNLTDEEEQFFLSLVDSYYCKRGTPDSNLKLYNFDTKYNTIHDDYYAVLTEWQYFAFVELIPLECFQYDEAWIASRLGVDKTFVKPMIDRLLKVKLIIEKDGKLYQNYDYFVSPSGTPSDTAKKFHNNILKKAMQAIVEQEIDERDFTSGFLHVRKSDLPYVAKRIKEFRRELAYELESGSNHDSVYAFSIQFFRADQE